MGNYQSLLIEWKDERKNITTRPTHTELSDEHERISVETVLINIKQAADLNCVGKGS